ncbi:hypothetical protein [Marisediminicola sp. LYQ134]|uniref:hypothetical protein n=1 Tax=Marisediminicola sp. LYQ134 TaxID=3391061 RepID=UPI0039830994
MTEVVVGDLRTGRRWQTVPHVTCRWAQRRNQPETLSAVIPIREPVVQRLDMRNTATEGKSYLGIIEADDTFPAAGPMLEPSYDRDRGLLTLTAVGMGSWFNGLPVLPPLADTINPAQFVVPDPTDSSATIPNPALATSFTDLSFGSIVRGLIAQWMAWPGGELPIVLPDVVPGTHELTIEGIDFKEIWDAIADITKQDDGIDVALIPRRVADRLGVEWVLRTGTNEQPRFRSETIHRWDLTVSQESVRALKVESNAASMASTAFFTGGRSADVALVERANDPYLTDLGYPRRIMVDSSHSTVEKRATLRAHANEAVKLGRVASRFWSFQVRKDGNPRFGEYQIGDLCQLLVKDDPYIPDSGHKGYLREIAAMSGDQGPWVTITTSEAFDG